MSARVAHRLPKTTGTVPCSRCLDVIDVQAGQWIAAELDAPHAVCRRCAGTPLVWVNGSLACPWRPCGGPGGSPKAAEALTGCSRPLHGDVASGAQR